MSIKLLIIFLMSFTLFLASCQPKTAYKNNDAATVDSAFYYVQKDINDPFLDTVFQTPDQTINLKMDIYPPSAQYSKFKS